MDDKLVVLSRNYSLKAKNGQWHHNRRGYLVCYCIGLASHG